MKEQTKRNRLLTELILNDWHIKGLTDRKVEILAVYPPQFIMNIKSGEIIQKQAEEVREMIEKIDSEIHNRIVQITETYKSYQQ